MTNMSNIHLEISISAAHLGVKVLMFGKAIICCKIFFCFIVADHSTMCHKRCPSKFQAL